MQACTVCISVCISDADKGNEAGGGSDQSKLSENRRAIMLTTALSTIVCVIRLSHASTGCQETLTTQKTWV